MKFSVFQINHDKDTERVIFESYERTIDWAGKIDPEIYDCVLTSGVGLELKEDQVADFLECLFAEMNSTDSGLVWNGRSMSVSDVVLLDGEAYFVDSVGFKKFPADGFIK